MWRTSRLGEIVGKIVTRKATAVVAYWLIVAAISEYNLISFSEPLRWLRKLNLDKKLRVALLIHSLDGGGAERAMSQLANRWAPRHEVHLVTWADAESDRYTLDAAVRRHALGFQSISNNLLAGVIANYRRVRALRGKLREINPDFVLSFCDQMNIVALEATRSMSRVPVWIAEHSDPERQRLSRFWEVWRRRSYPRCTGCIALTESIADYMTRWIPRERLRVIPSALQSLPSDSNYRPSNSGPSNNGPSNSDVSSSGISSSGISSSGDSSSGDSSSDVSSNTLLYVGRLSTEKRIDLLLNAWKLVQDQLPQWNLTIVGDGSSRKELQLQAEKLQRVHFAGWVQDPETYFSTSQLFVLCSSYEGFPVALLEALSHGLPVVTTACSSAISELQSANFNEFLRVVVPDTPAAIAEAIMELALAPDRRSAMSQQARITAANYTWEKIGAKWDEILNATTERQN